MQYALLIYGPRDGAVAAVLDRPYVIGWASLHDAESATTLRTRTTPLRADEGRTLLSDGPFIDSKEFLAGLVMIEVDDLDGALAVAQEVQQNRTGGAIEVRPVRDGRVRGA
jgi:hypothetical protein